MIEESPSRDRFDVACWQCGEPSGYAAGEDIGEPAAIIDVLVGFLIGLLCNALRDRTSGICSLGSDPPLFALRQFGWQHAE